jgi:hypothetical protein
LKLDDRLERLALLALFVTSLVVVHRWSGQSPRLWQDTLSDQREVRRCLEDGECTLVGQAASISGLWVAGGWLHVRTALARLGVGLEGVHALMQALDALGVSLVALAGFRLAGYLLGSVAAFAMIAVLGSTGATRQAVYNTSPLAFLGALLLVASIEAVSRPSVRSSVMTAMLAAVMACTHTVCAPLGASVVWVAALRPERRALRMVVAAISFALVAFILVPVGWIENANYVLHRGAGGTAAPTVPLSDVLAIVRHQLIASWALITVVAALVARAVGTAKRRSLLDVPLALAAPVLAVFVLGVARGVGDAGGKYLVPIKAAAALGTSAALVALAGFLATALARLARGAVHRFAAGRARELRAHADRAAGLATLARRAAPFAACAAIFMWSPALASPPVWNPSLFTMRDLEAIVSLLHRERSWSRTDVARRVVACEQSPIQLALLDEVGGGWQEERSPTQAVGPDDERVFLAMLDAAELPDPMPSNWHVARRTGTRAAVVIFTRSALDWSQARMCETEQGPCFSRDVVVDESSVPWTGTRGRVSVHVPVRSGAGAVSSEIFMPRLETMCGGNIRGVAGSGSRIFADGRRAVLAPLGAGDSAGDVVLEWEVPSADCPGYTEAPTLPFFVDGDAVTVSALEAILRRHEASTSASSKGGTAPW